MKIMGLISEEEFNTEMKELKVAYRGTSLILETGAEIDLMSLYDDAVEQFTAEVGEETAAEILEPSTDEVSEEDLEFLSEISFVVKAYNTEEDNVVILQFLANGEMLSALKVQL